MSESKLEPIVYNSTEAARMLGISPRTLANWRCQGRGPRYAHLSDDPHSPIIYRRTDLEEWLDERFKACC